MTHIDDIAIGLIKTYEEKNRNLELHIESHIQKAIGRGLMKMGALGIVGLFATLGSTVWTLRGYFADQAIAQRAQGAQIEEIQKQTAVIPQILTAAINAQNTADIAKAKIDGHLAPDVITTKGAHGR